MKKGLILGLAAGAAAVAAAAFIYKKKQEEYCDYEDDIDADFECDSCCCDCDEDMPEEKVSDGAIETDHCSASNVETETDDTHDTDITGV